MHKKCLICRSKDEKDSISYNNYDYSFLSSHPDDKNIFSQLEILTCNNCNFSFAFPAINKEELKEFYKRDYSDSRGPHGGFKKLKVYTWKYSFDARSLSQLMLAGQYIDLSKVENFLDVGPSYGTSFRMFRKLGHNPNCFAIEYDESKHKGLNRMNVNIIKPDNINMALDSINKSFDIILMSHVLEHFDASDLVEIINNLKKALSDKGLLIIEVPNDKNNSNYLNGKNHIPHLSFFSIKSLKKLLIDNGFNIDFISTARKKRKFINHQLLNDSKLKSNFRSLKPIYFLYSFFRYGVLQDLLSIWNYYMNNNISHFLNSPDFTYGADRMIIRSIASKK